MKVPFDIRFCAESWREGSETATVAGKAVLRFRRFWRRSIIAATFQELRQRCAFARLTDQPLDDLRPAQPALL